MISAFGCLSDPVDLMNDPLESRLLGAYPALDSVPPLRLSETAAHLPVVRVERGTQVFAEGDPCGGFPCVLEGEVRVARGSRDGRELELYRVRPGDICVVSASCLFGERPMAAYGRTTRDTVLALVDRQTLLEWTDARPFREYLFGVMAERMAALSILVDALAFQRLDQRLARVLVARGDTVQSTHQRLADELGTSREIVSRLLGRFEDQGFVRLGRERIDLLDINGLRRIADAV